MVEKNIFTFLNSLYPNDNPIIAKEKALPLIPYLNAVSFKQNGNLFIAKYNLDIWNYGFNPILKTARGIVWDDDAKKVVSHPFDKFFNLDEVEETSLAVARKKLSSSFTATEKKDGSLIAVTNYNGEPLITTNFSFDNEQTAKAREILKSRYPFFYGDVPPYLTFIFEIIYPENRIVVDYGDEEELYLLAVRDLNTDLLLPSYPTFGFPTPKRTVATLDSLIETAHEWKRANFEGWVLRNDQYMVKLKLEEYFQLHKIATQLTPKFVYESWQSSLLDDYLSTLDPNEKEKVNEILGALTKDRNQISSHISSLSKAYLLSFNLSHLDFKERKEDCVKLIKKLGEEEPIFSSYVLNFLKGKPINWEILPWKKFQMLAEEVRQQ